MAVAPEERALGFNLLDILHVRLGHMSERNIKYAIKNGLFADCPVTFDEISDLKLRTCYTCQMGRMPTFASGGLTGKGPLGTRCTRHYTRFYLVSDHSSGGVWSYPCVNKDEDTLFHILEIFFKYTVDRTSFIPHIMHCDRDSVITGGLIFKYIMDRGMDIHASIPYIHHQNGQVERAMQTVLDKTRTLLYASQDLFVTGTTLWRWPRTWFKGLQTATTS
jgi:hypothetical protein